jgi:hypothetical protein
VTDVHQYLINVAWQADPQSKILCERNIHGENKKSSGAHHTSIALVTK